MTPNITKEQALKALEAIEAWANNYPHYLSESKDFARGYKQGIIQAQCIIREILAENLAQE